MVTNSTHCLSDAELRLFTAGRLPDDRFAPLLDHLDSCQACQNRVDEAADGEDSIAAVLRDRASDCPIIAEADCQAALLRAASQSVANVDSSRPPIEELGPYRLIRRIGRGGMGAVYLAEHTRLRKKYAIKLLPRERGFDTDWLGRFDREMQAVASLQHPNIVTATDAGDVGGWHYLVMEYLDGLDLATVSRRCGPLAVADAAAIGRDLCAALQVVHESGLVHRDVKPSNVMLTRDGVVKLLDLGLVLSNETSADDMRLTTVGHVMGTVAFAAPEQLSADEEVDARADLYGLGATLFQLLAGRPPYTSRRGIAPLVIEKTSQPAPSLDDVGEGIPDELSNLVARLLERNPADRPASAEEVGTVLEPLAATSLKPLAREAIRRSDASEFAAEPYGIGLSEPKLAASTGRQPIGKRVAAILVAAAAALAGFIFYIQTDRGTLVVESEVDDVEVSINQDDEAVGALTVSQGEGRTTLRSGTYRIDFNTDADNLTLSDNQIAIRRGEETVVKVRRETGFVSAHAAEQKLFKGKPLSYYTKIIQSETDVTALGEAMVAISKLADGDDVEAAHAILIPARRYGGWAFGRSGDAGEFYTGTEASPAFMYYFLRAMPELMPSPGFQAIVREFKLGNSRSWAAILGALDSFNLEIDPAIGRYSTQSDKLFRWAADPSNRSLAVDLHDSLRQLLTNPKLDQAVPGQPTTETLSARKAREVSLKLAMVLRRKLSDEPKLEEYLHRRIEAIEMAATPVAQRMEILGDEGVERVVFPNHEQVLAPLELVAATRLGIELPATIWVPSLLGHSKSVPWLNRQATEIALDRLQQNEQLAADEAVAWLVSRPHQPAATINSNEQLWSQLLLKIASATSQPQLLVQSLVYMLDQQANKNRTGGGGFGWKSEQAIESQQARKAATEALGIAEERLLRNRDSLGSLQGLVDDAIIKNIQNEKSDSAKKDLVAEQLAPLLESQLLRMADRDGDSEVSEVELAWHRQKEAWKQDWIGESKGIPTTGLGGGGQF